MRPPTEALSHLVWRQAPTAEYARHHYLDKSYTSISGSRLRELRFLGLASGELIEPPTLSV